MKNKLFELRQNENVAITLRKHWFVFVPLIALCLFLILVPLAGLHVLRINNVDLGEYQALAMMGFSVFLLLTLAFFITAFIDYYLDVGFVTNFRIIDIDQKGLFHRSVAEQNLIRIQDVAAKQNGILQTFLNYGDVFIETAGEAPNFEFYAIPKPQERAQTIMRYHHELMRSGTKETQEKMDNEFKL